MEVGGYNFPDDLYYHKDHAWAKVEGDVVTIGMNEMFQDSAGDIVFVDLPFEDDDVEAGETCGKLQSSKWIGNLVAPVSGEVVEINEDIEGDSGLINSDPYGDGWLIKIKASNLEEELAELMKVDALEPFVKAEIERAEKLKSEDGE